MRIPYIPMTGSHKKEESRIQKRTISMEAEREELVILHSKYNGDRLYTGRGIIFNNRSMSLRDKTDACIILGFN